MKNSISIMGKIDDIKNNLDVLLDNYENRNDNLNFAYDAAINLQNKVDYLKELIGAELHEQERG